MISFTNNPEYYTKDIQKSLLLAKQLPHQDKKDNLHLFWVVPKEFSEKQEICLRSILATQDLEKLDVYLWSNVDLTSNKFLIPYLPYLNFKIWDFVKESKDTPLEKWIETKNLYSDPSRYVSSDLFRLMCLYRYGGFYLDMDCLALRDLSPLKAYQFAYQWGETGIYEHKPFRVNNAVLRLEKESKLSLELLETLKQYMPSPNSFNWGSYLFNNFMFREDLQIFPAAWFDTEWHLFDAAWHPFKKYEGCSELYDGAFVWHWHNKWDEKIESGSKMDILNKKMINLFREKFYESV
jgi:hypothetical protein